MRLRSKAREIALCALYGGEVSKRVRLEVLDNYFDNFPQKSEAKEFAAILVSGVEQHIFHLDKIIKEYVKNWEIERMAVIDRNILRLGTFELLFLDDIPPKVSINEAVELAKKFGDIDSPRFVNGVLDKIFKHESVKGKQ